ncbi:Bro-N domain-containing protein [Photobacterium halotolerans]|uniref:BRO-N domain-containing protein n=1 Tax=Photobacterium halotolerans TaxID=265726 RepID=UPI0013735801|nr:BRO family protein [Photobacterium halotolerans]NAW86629.1 hypothetical protein [Photobacterium halotolerans]
MANQLTFQNVSLDAIVYGDQIFITSTDLARALGYKSDNAVTKIYNRNADEFSECMTHNLPNLGKRIFSLRGAHLIAMFSRTETAKDFRKWVLDILDTEVSRQPLPKPPSPALSYLPDLNVTLNDLIYEIAQLRGVSTEQIRIHYSHVFNSQNWTAENEFVAALARSVLRRDLETERAKATPDMLQLVAMAKARGFHLVNESDFLAFQGQLQMQQEQIEKLIDKLVNLSRNNRWLMSHGLWQ